MKYEPLRHYLEHCRSDVASLGFEEIESILGSKLPPSARKHPAWWSNHARGHVNAQAWLDAGYATQDVDLQRAKVVFRRQNDDGATLDEIKPMSFVDRIRAEMGGTVKIMPGVDLTAPLWMYESDDV